MVFEYGNKLTVFQEGIFSRYKANKLICDEDYFRLQNNLWVDFAEKVAPNNLVVRQLCLIDLFSNVPHNVTRIVRLMKNLTYSEKFNGEVCLYAEGYCYWVLYVKPFLEKYRELFPEERVIQSIIKNIDAGFRATAYQRGDLLYPAPFGELKDMPLEGSLQDGCGEQESICINPVVKAKNRYFIKSMPLGLNRLIPSKNAPVYIGNGIPIDFKWSRREHKNRFEELKDLFSFRRLKSIFVILF